MFGSKSNLKSIWEKYLKELSRQDLSSFSNPALDNALNAEMDRAMKKNNIKPLKELKEVWESSMESPDQTFGYYIEIGLAKRALSSNNIGIAEWLLTNAPNEFKSEALGERKQMVKLLEYNNAIDSLVKICYKSSQYLDRYHAAHALGDLRGNDAVAILDNCKNQLSGIEETRLQESYKILKESLDARMKFQEKQRNEESMRQFIQEVIQKTNPTLDDIETSIVYMEENPELISGFKRMSTIEKLREKKENLEK